MPLSSILALLRVLFCHYTTPAGRTNNLIKQILSSSRTQAVLPPATPAMASTEEVIQVDGTFNHHINATNAQYDLSNHGASTVMSFLMDGVANGGKPSSDIGVIPALAFHKANITNIGETAMEDLPLVATANFVKTLCGPATIFLHQYVHYDKGHTIHSAGRLHAFGTQVHQVPRRQGAQYRSITSAEGFHIPLSYHSGLLNMDICPPTNAELHSLPHILLNSNLEWNPSCLNDEFSCNELSLIDLLI
jgi:hypothetical protein